VEIRKVGVVGLGTMGAGIAQVSVQSGFDTVGREVNDDLGERGRTTIERYLARGVEKGRLTK
jgi:3-hydroxybutyryl-CoA dehydrogenase